MSPIFSKPFKHATPGLPLALLGAAAVLAGCASIPEQAKRLDDDAGSIEIADAPFFPQQEYQCGPAALATVLVRSGVATTPDALKDSVYLPGRQGSMQPELLAATRAAGRIPYEIDGTLGAIHAELEAGRPVLVLQNLGIRLIPRWHYAVVVGIYPDEDSVRLRSGTDRRRESGIATFLRTWQRGDFWAFIALRPGELPERADAIRFIEALSAFESTGQRSTMLESWQIATERWPQNAIALFGHANAEFANGNFARAEDIYRRVIDLRPDYLMAANNLALALAEQGKYGQALEQIEQVLLNAGPEDALGGEYDATRREILAMAPENGSRADGRDN